MARKKISTSTDQRPFSLIYHDFIDSGILKSDEITLFVVLKRFADEDGNCFPSLKKLSAKSGLSKRKVQDLLKRMEEKKVITKEKRARADGGYSSNLYHLNDTAKMWQAGSVEEMKAAVDEIEEQHMIEILTAKGYTISKEPKKAKGKEKDKEKGLVSYADQSNDTSTQLNQFDIDNPTSNFDESQDLERYTIEQIRQLFDYNIMLQDHLEQKQDIDTVMSILHTAMNTTKPTIRIAGQDKPAMVVIGKFMKLDKESIMYAIKKFSEQTNKINNPIAYMTTILYTAQEQYYLDMKNQVNNERAKTDHAIEGKNTPSESRCAAFHNFKQRTYDYEALEQELLRR